MRISDIMTEKVETVMPDTPVTDIARKMKERDCGSIFIESDDRLVGVVTDRDIAVRCVAESQDPVTINAEQIMTPGVLYCYEDEDADHIANNMGENAIRRLPVLNRDKRLVGVVSLGDLSVAVDNEGNAGEAMERIRLAS